MYTGKSGTQMSENQESGSDKYFGNTNTHKPMNVIEEYPIHEKKDTAHIIIATAIIWDMHRNRKIIEKQ